MITSSLLTSVHADSLLLHFTLIINDMKRLYKRVLNSKKPSPSLGSIHGPGQATFASTSTGTIDPMPSILASDSESDGTTFDIAERRIQTLTSILQRMNPQCSPTSDRKQVPAFLRHLATLLTCDTSDDPDARRVITVTGTLAAEELRTLIVSQNPSGSSDVSEFGVQQITKSIGTFEELVKPYVH